MKTVSHQYDTPLWLHRKSKHRIWLRDLRPHVLCKDYSKRHQMKKSSSKGDMTFFEVYFVDGKGM